MANYVLGSTDYGGLVFMIWFLVWKSNQNGGLDFKVQRIQQISVHDLEFSVKWRIRSDYV